MSDKNSQNVDASKQTLMQNAGNIISVIMIALAAFFGWQYFQKNKTASVDTVAADKFNNVQQLSQSMTTLKQSMPEETDESKAIVETQSKAFNTELDNLIANHGETVYAWQGLMLKARQQMDNSEFSAASETLKQATEVNLKDAGLKAISQLRYGQSLLADGKTDEALNVAKQEMPASFIASQQELLGDIYQAQDNTEEATRAYENAWKVLVERKENRAVLALKMESLGIEAEAITVDSIVEQPKIENGVPELPEGAQIVDALPDELPESAEQVTIETTESTDKAEPTSENEESAPSETNLETVSETDKASE